MDLNFNNLSTDSNGRLRFSGITSGIDTQGLVDSIIKSKRIVATQIEDKISVNETRVTAYNELKTLSANFAAQLDLLRNPSGYQANDIFESKVGFAESQSTSGAPSGHVPSAASAILGISMTNQADASSHVVEVVQTAKANQVRSDMFSSKTDSLSSLGFTTGSLEINGQTVNVGSNDSLLDLRDKINGSTDMNVSASIVSVSSTEHYLVLTSKDTGVDNAITFGTSTQAVHNSLGLTATGTDTAKTQIQEAKNAIIRVDNLGVDIERPSNAIDDVLEGITLDLYKAEANTEIAIDVEADLSSIKTTISDFVDSYNALKDFISDQNSQVVREEGGEEEYGVLYGDTTMRQISQKLSQVVSSSVPGLDDGFASLGQVGIDINSDYRLEIDNEEFDNNLLTNLKNIQKLFGLDVSVSDSRVSVASISQSTSYQVDSNGDPLPYYLSIAGTDADGKVISATMGETAGAGTAGSNNGSVTTSGNILTMTDSTGANGLKLIFTGDANLGPVEDIEVSFTRGIADSLFDFFNNVSQTSGAIDQARNDTIDQNSGLQESVDKIDARLALQRATLTNKFLAMEDAMFRLQTLQDQLEQQITAMNGGNK